MIRPAWVVAVELFSWGRPLGKCFCFFSEYETWSVNYLSRQFFLANTLQICAIKTTFTRYSNLIVPCMYNDLDKVNNGIWKTAPVSSPGEFHLKNFLAIFFILFFCKWNLFCKLQSYLIWCLMVSGKSPQWA